MSRETQFGWASRQSPVRRRRAARPIDDSARRRHPKFESLEDRLALATLTVTSLADGAVNLGDATVTLRDALHAADNNLQVAPGGPTGGATDDVIIQPGLVGVITLTQGQLAIRSDVS